ncbi:MAG: AraC family transcriptional regulator [Ekhidna sp.]
MGNISIFIIIGLSFAIVFLAKQVVSIGLKRPVSLAPFVLIFILITELFYGWLYASHEILVYPYLVRINSPFLYLIGPALYFVILGYADPKRKWQKNDVWHIIPFVLAICYLIPLYTSSTDLKADYLHEMYQQLGFDSILLGSTRRIHQGVYLGVSILLITKKSKSLHIHRTIKSAKMIVAAFTVLWVLSIFRFFFSFDLLSALMDTILLVLIAIYLVYNQLSGKIYKPSTHIRIDPHEVEHAMAKIEELMIKEKLFIDPHFTIKDMADKLEMPVPTISLIINRGMNANFNELINHYKVEEAVRLLGRTDTRHLTIEAIAKQAGFNSTSAFNDNFRKKTGQSPKAYRN